MAAVVPPSDQAADLLHDLHLDSENKTLQAPDSTKQVSAIQYAPLEPGTVANGINRPFERSTSPFNQDFTGPSMFYSPNGYTSSTYPSSTYYYGGYDGSSTNEWEGFTGPDGVEMPQGMFGEYQHGYGYAPYGTYSPSSVGHDRQQLYGPQQYQYPSSYFQSSSSTSGSYPSNQSGNTSQTAVPSSVTPDQVQFPAETTKANQNRTVTHHTNMSKSGRPTYQSSSVKPADSFGWGGMPSASPWVSSTASHGSNFSSGTAQNLRPLPPSVGLQHPGASSAVGGYMNQMYHPSNRMYSQYGNTFRSGLGYSPSIYDIRSGGRNWSVADHKYRARGRGNGLSGGNNNESSVDSLNEMNRGPRGKGFKDQKDSEPISLEAVKGQSLPLKGNCDEDNLPLFPDREQYNKDDFPETYSDAKFFVIKSYSEDDIHKSIKYGVWASTPNGNKKLDAAYKEAEERCPVFLLFSVNASGQFVGLAEMVGPVDFDKTVEYWQQDKWNGCFPVKWHIVKDVPNSMLRHITLQNNENKPVTNSRDTQEVKLDLGLQILKIFKTLSSKTCILDDFDFYEGRQKIMQEKKAKQRLLNKQVAIMNQCAAASSVDKEGSQNAASSGGSVGLHRSEDGGELKHSEEVTLASTTKTAHQSLQPNVKDNEALLNGVGNAC